MSPRPLRHDAMRLPSWALAAFRLTRREYFADFFITPPITACLAIYSLAHASWWWPIGFAAGAFLWSAYEYALHRWALHESPILRDLHAMHHRNQRDYIAIHPVATLATYGLFWVLFGVHSSALMVGFSCGYIAYAGLHTWFHYGTGLAFSRLRWRHVLHHRHNAVNYGVTTAFWDRLFGTEYLRV